MTLTSISQEAKRGRPTPDDARGYPHCSCQQKGRNAKLQAIITMAM